MYMLYKPHYCCHCGEKIERIEWFPWTSRRFCEVCAAEFKVHDWIPRILVGIGLLLSVFGLGSYLQSPKRENPVAVKQKLTEASKSSQISENQRNVALLEARASQPEQSSANNQLTPAPQISKVQKNQTEIARKETIYFCGAETKKGTPCSRRVKRSGRCWQHEGQPAMLPPEKLVVSQ